MRLRNNEALPCYVRESEAILFLSQREEQRIYEEKMRKVKELEQQVKKKSERGKRREQEEEEVFKINT